MIDFLSTPPDIETPPPCSAELTFPAPWFGGKRRAAALIWERFGDVPNLVEFDGGSGAVTLARPAHHRPRIETINDLDGLLVNFWRALRGNPEGVAAEADYPVAEVDLHARHRCLIARRETLADELERDPGFYDVRAAGWWVWGASAWIGDGWCTSTWRQLPDIGGSKSNVDDSRSNQGKGVHSIALRSPSRQLPDLGGSTARGECFANAGKGINGFGMREPSRQMPQLSGSNGGHGCGVHSMGARTALYDTFARLAARLRYVRFPCGDWRRVSTPAVTWRHGTTAILIDPEYPSGTIRYAVGERGSAAEQAAWALENGDDKRLRIAFCGYDGDFAFPGSWECVAWKASGGYANQRKDGENENARRERIWFSPHCLKAATQGDLFAAGAR